MSSSEYETQLFSESEDLYSDNRVSFVNALKDNTVVFNKSLCTKTIVAKEKAWTDICVKYITLRLIVTQKHY